MSGQGDLPTTPTPAPMDADNEPEAADPEMLAFLRAYSFGEDVISTLIREVGLCMATLALASVVQERWPRTPNAYLVGLRNLHCKSFKTTPRKRIWP